MTDVKRAKVLLKAAHDLLNSCYETPYVKCVMSEIVHYDNAECDGCCLMGDIEAWLEDNTGETQ